jgi:Rhs element Vgr protein
MNDARRLPIERSTDLPTFTVRIEGNKIPDAIQVIAITIQKSINRIPNALLTLSDGDAAAQDFPLSNMDSFVPGKKIEISAGYHRDEQRVFAGVIVGQSVKVRAGRGPVLFVQCRDRAARLTVAAQSAYYRDKSDGDVIAELLRAQELESEVGATGPAHPAMVRHQATDWDYIVMRAEANGMLVSADDGRVTVAKPSIQAPALTLNYGATLLELEAELDARRQLPSAKTRGWDAASQAPREVTAREPSLRGAGNLGEDELASVLDQPMQLAYAGVLREQELQSWADARLLRSRLAKVLGRARCQGFGAVKPGQTLGLRGVGERFSGDLFIAAVQHDLSPQDWHTTLQFGLSERTFASEHDASEQPAAGLVPSISGLHIGVVTKLEGDPDGEQRVRVRMPLTSAADDGVWARLASLDAGNQRGATFRPELDDEVVLGFLQGDPRQPIVLGMLHSSAKPSPLEPSDENAKKGFTTRQGMRVMFDDAEKSITIDTPAGNAIVLSEDSGGIEISDQSGNTLSMSDQGIELSSQGALKLTASGDLKLSGKNVTLEANAQLTAKGNAGAELSTSGQCVVKGSLVQIN